MFFGGSIWTTRRELTATEFSISEDCSGLYLADCQFGDFAAEHARDYQTARRLWHLSEELIGEKFSME